jgi:hypothetical protein
MNSSTTRLGNGPTQIAWHSEWGARPFQAAAFVIGMLELAPENRGSDFLKGLQQSWEAFLHLRTSIEKGVADFEHRTNGHCGDQRFFNLRCELVTADEAAADYLRYLPPALVPPNQYLKEAEITECGAQFEQLKARVEKSLIDRR